MALRPRKRSDAIAEAVKRWMIAESKQPGDRLPQEKHLATLFQCSKGTVREALKSLEVQGLITVRTGPQGGATLAEVSYERSTALLRNFLHFQALSAEQVYALRKVVEVELAASVVGHLSEAQLAALEANLAGCADPAHRHGGDQTRLRQLELDFHVILASACPNPLLAFLSRFLGDLLRDFLRFRREMRDAHHEFTLSNMRFHRALIEAYRAEDREAVRRLMAEHMEAAERHTVALEGFLAPDLLLAP